MIVHTPSPSIHSAPAAHLTVWRRSRRSALPTPQRRRLLTLLQCLRGGWTPKQRQDPRQANFDWDWWREELNRFSFEHHATTSMATIDLSARKRIVKALGMLGSSHDGEVLSAARVVEACRRRIGVTWEQLIVAVTERECDSAA